MTTQVALLKQDRVDLAATTAAAGIVPAAVYLARLAPGSRRTMRHALQWMAEEFSNGHANLADFPWSLLRYEHTQAIRAKLAERYKPATANKMLCALRGVLKECWRLNQMDSDEMHRAADIQPIRGSSIPKGRALTVDQLRILLMHVDNHRDRVLLRFMAVSGLRRAEVAAVTWNDLDTVQQGVRVQGKGNKERFVPLPDIIWGPLAASMGTASLPSDRVFNVSPQRIWQIIRKASFAAGMTAVSPHDLRRTYATTLWAAGIDLPTIQRLMGHADPKTTAGYDRRGTDAAAAAVQRVFRTTP